MDPKTKLQFNEDGTECKVVFKDGTESGMYKSKITLLKDLFMMMLTEDKIEPEELEDLTKEAMGAPKLADGEPEMENVEIRVMSINVKKIPTPAGTGFKGGLSDTLLSPETMKEISDLEKNPPTDIPCFKMSKVNESYGWIFVESGILGNKIKSKHYGLKALEFLEKAGEISKEGRDKLTTQIDQSNIAKFP